MTQELFPEIQAAAEALQTRITVTESEIAQMKDGIKNKKELVRAWRKALATCNPQLATKKKRANATSALSSPGTVLPG